LAAASAVSGCSRVSAHGNDDDLGTRVDDKLRVSVIGLGGWGKNHVAAFARRKDVEIAYLCDVDAAIRERVSETLPWYRRPRLVEDMRRIFDDPRVDAVSIATPHHWHALAALWALQAGKHVYLEKPVSQCFAEGSMLVRAVRASGKIVQTGTQRRSNTSMGAAVGYMRAGELGRIDLVHCLAFKLRKPIGAGTACKVPESVNLDLWTGPAAAGPPARTKFHYDWHWFWDTGNGAIGNNGVHRVDVACWGLGIRDLGCATFAYGGRFGEPDAGETPNTQVAVHAYPQATIVQQVRGMPAGTWRGHKDGILFFGERGTIVVVGEKAVLFDERDRPVCTFDGDKHNHWGNWVRAVLANRPQDLTADIEAGHVAAGLCHLANNSYRLGQPMTVEEIGWRAKEHACHDDVDETLAGTVEYLTANQVGTQGTQLRAGPWLAMDGATETIAGCPEGAALLEREYRAPYGLPSA
jgi:predicted dehydrogenase